MTKNKTSTAIATILITTFAISIIALPSTYAQLNVPYVSTGRYFTRAFIGAMPNPVGVGEETLLHVGIQTQLSSVERGWEGLTVTVTKPDNTTETLGPVRTDSTGGTGIVYRPSMTGTYYLQTHFPEQRMPSAAAGIPVNTTMLASVSDPLALVVNNEPIQYYPTSPLPTEYWTRPVNAQLREWYTISGSSWEDNKYNEAPESPHILWTKPLTMGGLVGGSLGLVGSGGTSVAFENGDAYEGKWSSRLILAGRLYYVSGAYDRPTVTYCVDLRTGEELWSKVFLANATISSGQMYYFQSFNYQGTFAYLWVTSGTNWTAFDAFTGEQRWMMTSVPSGTNLYGDRGEIYRYSVSLSGGYMYLWNSSKVGAAASGMSSGSWGSQVSLRTINATQRGMEWNITIPKGLPGSVRAVKLGDKVVGSNTLTSQINLWAFSLKPGQEGTLLYNKTWMTPSTWTTGNVTFSMYGSSWSTTDMDANIGLIWNKEEITWYAFDLTTGEFMWKSEVPEYYLDIYSIGGRIAYGRLYSVGMAGIVYCWNATNGKLLWTYNAVDPYTEMLWGNNWPLDLLFVNNNRLYFFHSEHSANQPLPRGAPAVCLNAETGEEIWRVDGLFRKTDWGGSPIMGDSVIAMYNTYDQQVYAIGKGPSAMKVEAPMTATTLGSSLVIRGTVTDVSPGAEQTSVKLRFPYGVPAVSDESQGEWMKYVYAQFERPTDVKGVDVTISVLDSNNNYRDIGTATADADGFFKFTWTPDIEGDYTVYASFAGSGSYYPSHAVSAFTVDPAPPAAAEPQPEPEPMTDTYVLGMGIAIIAAVAIVGAILALILKKRA
jgi:hypothetical protein